MIVKNTDAVQELRKSADFQLDQMDEAFASVKSFSGMFDTHVKSIHALVAALLEPEVDTASIDAKKTIRNIPFNS